MKVAIVGGGLAGLSAALDLVDAGHEVAVYEARPTLGGAVQTLPRRERSRRLGPVVKGRRFVRADYGQIEPRILLRLLRERGLIAWDAGADLYRPHPGRADLGGYHWVSRPLQEILQAFDYDGDYGKRVACLARSLLRPGRRSFP